MDRIKVIQLDDKRELRVTETSAYVFYKKTGCIEFVYFRQPHQSYDDFLTLAKDTEQYYHSIGWV